jgi:hypothetical protein
MHMTAFLGSFKSSSCQLIFGRKIVAKRQLISDSRPILAEWGRRRSEKTETLRIISFPLNSWTFSKELLRPLQARHNYVVEKKCLIEGHEFFLIRPYSTAF